jgi:hypothetical protein
MLESYAHAFQQPDAITKAALFSEFLEADVIGARIDIGRCVRVSRAGDELSLVVCRSQAMLSALV